MRFLPVSVLLLSILPGAGVCLMAQTPPPPGSAPSMTSADGVTIPLQVIAPPVIPADRVVIQVGDVKLTSGQMGMIMEAYPENQRVWIDGPGRQPFIDQVVRLLVLAEEGRRRQLDQTEKYRTQFSYSATGILATHTDAYIRQSAKPTAADLQAYYDLHKNEFTELRVRHILVRTRGSAVPLLPNQADLSEEEALAKANQIRQKIAAGEDFAELARTESSDEGTLNKGGELGFFKHGQMMPSFEEAAYKLDIGDLSQPVKTPYGYHIIQVEEKKVTRTAEQMRPDMEKAFANDLSKKFLEELKSKAKIAIDPEFGATSKPAAGPKQP
jgi:peptidyl-prolyl cis-trans isomerase C